KGSRADDLGDRRKRIRHRLLLAHDATGDAIAAAEQELDEAEGLLQTQYECPIIDRLERRDARGQRLNLTVALEEAPKRRDHVAGRQRAAVAEFEPRTQHEGVEQLVVRDGPALDQ